MPHEHLAELRAKRPIEPRHVARWVEGDGLVERCKGAFDITTTTAFFTDGEQHLNHFLGVFDLLKFGNDVPWRLRWLFCSRCRFLQRFVLHGFKGLIHGRKDHFIKGVMVVPCSRPDSSLVAILFHRIKNEHCAMHKSCFWLSIRRDLTFK